MIFPAAAVIMSDMVPRNQQGIAGSLVATVVNYSIFIGLGIAGTVVSQMDSGADNRMRQFQGVWYAGIGLSGCSVLLALYFTVVHNIHPPIQRSQR